jgi:V/A-type H+-transporting ATPase subunit K
MENMVVQGFDWSAFSAYFGLGLLLLLGLSGSAIGLSIAGSAVTGVRDDKRASALIVSLLPGTQGLYAFAVGFLCLQKLIGEDPQTWFLTVLTCGLATGGACLFSGWFQGQVCAAGIKSMNQDRIGLGQVILLAVIVEFYAILGFAFAALMLFK